MTFEEVLRHGRREAERAFRRVLREPRYFAVDGAGTAVEVRDGLTPAERVKRARETLDDEE